MDHAHAQGSLPEVEEDIFTIDKIVRLDGSNFVLLNEHHKIVIRNGFADPSNLAPK